MDEVTELENDTRNLQDEYKGLSNELVCQKLDETRTPLEIAIENVEHDFNVGTIVRSANNFNAQAVHIIGRRKFNRRGAMCTDKYLKIIFWDDVEKFYTDQKLRNREVVAIENHTKRALPLVNKKFVQNTTLLFGSEGSGLTEKCLALADDVREIEGLGSTRSINVGVAAGIAMYEWARQCVLENKNK